MTPRPLSFLPESISPVVKLTSRTQNLPWPGATLGPQDHRPSSISRLSRFPTLGCTGAFKICYRHRCSELPQQLLIRHADLNLYSRRTNYQPRENSKLHDTHIHPLGRGHPPTRYSTTQQLPRTTYTSPTKNATGFVAKHFCNPRLFKTDSNNYRQRTQQTKNFWQLWNRPPNWTSI